MYIVNKISLVISAFLMLASLSCNSGPQPIKLGADACDFCKMSIADQHFGAEIITKKGKVYKFDDMHCILAFMKSNISKNDIKETWLVNFNKPHNFILAEKAFLLKSDELHSPMGGNVASFDDESKMKETMKDIKGEVVTWNQLVNGK
jgi:copper chaperone NosL